MCRRSSVEKWLAWCCSALGRKRCGNAGGEQVRSGQYQGSVARGGHIVGAERENVVHRDVGYGRDECHDRFSVRGERDLQSSEQETVDVVAVDEVEYCVGEQSTVGGHRGWPRGTALEEKLLLLRLIIPINVT